MIWPTIIVDNFFDEPNKVVEYSKKLNFKKNPEGIWPGERTNQLANLDINFFNWVIYRIIRVMFPMNHKNFTWNADQFFQKINGKIYTDEGWVHSDIEDEVTAIIYLSNHKNCGTSLYTPKYMSNGVMHTNEKEEGYKNLNLKKSKKYLKENNELFEKNLTIDSKFNRLVLFDSKQFHAADMFGDNVNDDERLTLITFFHQIHTPYIKYPLTEMRRHF
jgi:hypothetical protein